MPSVPLDDKRQQWLREHTLRPESIQRFDINKFRVVMDTENEHFGQFYKICAMVSTFWSNILLSPRTDLACSKLRTEPDTGTNTMVNSWRISRKLSWLRDSTRFWKHTALRSNPRMIPSRWPILKEKNPRRQRSQVGMSLTLRAITLALTHDSCIDDSIDVPVVLYSKVRRMIHHALIYLDIPDSLRIMNAHPNSRLGPPWLKMVCFLTGGRSCYLMLPEKKQYFLSDGWAMEPLPVQGNS